MDDGSDDESGSDFGKSKKPFSSDEEDELLDNTGINEASIHQAQLDESADLFDSLKEDSPKKPQKRKLGAKPEVVKDPSTKTSAKRSKKAVSDDDSPIKVKPINRTKRCTKFKWNYVIPSNFNILKMESFISNRNRHPKRRRMLL